MTMHLEKPFLTTTRYGSKGQKVANTAAKRKAESDHDAWLRKQGVHPDQLCQRKSNGKALVTSIPDYGVARKDRAQLSNNLAVSGGYRRTIMDNLHKESPAVQQAILEKASRLAPAYSKGAYQYISPGTDLSDVGKKK